MSSKTTYFLEVSERIKSILSLDSDVSLAESLGMTRTAFSVAKTRSTLPRKQIDALIAEHHFNPEFIYQGTGRVDLLDNADSWLDQFAGRIAPMLKIVTFTKMLSTKGYKQKDFDDAAKGKVKLELLRDIRKYLNADLNWIVCGDAPVQTDKKEDKLIAAYRAANAQGKAFIEQACGMAAPPPPVVKQTMHGDGIQAAGDVSGNAMTFNPTPRKRSNGK